jgi:hypothetical protein
MTADFLPPQRRRGLALCVATVLLHYLVLNWVERQIGMPALKRGEPVTVVFVGQLAAAAVEARQAKAPAPARARPPVRARRPAPAAAAAPAAETDHAPDVAGMDGAADAADHVESATAPASAAVVEAAAEAPQAVEPAAPAPQQRHYKVSLPPSAEIALDVTRTDADGADWTGEAAMAWKLKDGGYSMTVEAGIRVLFARINLVRLTSEGRIGEDGFAPLTLTEKRRGRALTATHFNQQDGRITFSASERDYPLLPGTQDKATLPLQLAAIARGDPDQLSGDIDILVGEDRDASVFRFVVLGQEEIQTRLGNMQAWHLSRPPQPGLYSSQLDIWLAPSRNWYPVQIRNTEANGAVTTQKVSNILITDSGT